MRLGILGSGQLAWMLTLAAGKRSINTRVIGGQPGDPAAPVADEFISESAVRESPTRALQGCDAVTFESEFVDFSNWGGPLDASAAKVFPNVPAMQRLSDKWEQKLLFAKLGIPTANARLHEGGSELPPGRWVAKWSRHGYDGYGNYFCTKGASGWADFCARASEAGARVYLEDEIAFTAECALLTARDAQGAVRSFPLLMSEQREGICEWVYGPAEHFLPASSAAIAELKPKLEKLLHELNYVGLIAFEFFWHDGKLLLNEVAPRVHNSGHITLDAFTTSQFDVHLDAAGSGAAGSGAGGGFTLPAPTAQAPVYMMKNILGVAGGSSQQGAQTFNAGSARVYWYGKKELRKGRKLGHINALFNAAATVDEMKASLRLSEKNAWAKVTAK